MLALVSWEVGSNLVGGRRELDSLDDQRSYYSTYNALDCTVTAAKYSSLPGIRSSNNKSINKSASQVLE